MKKSAVTISARKLVLTAMFACLAFELDICVHFPAMATIRGTADMTKENRPY